MRELSVNKFPPGPTPFTFPLYTLYTAIIFAFFAATNLHVLHVLHGQTSLRTLRPCASALKHIHLYTAIIFASFAFFLTTVASAKAVAANNLHDLHGYNSAPSTLTYLNHEIH